jgi:hypothetical protein
MNDIVNKPDIADEVEVPEEVLEESVNGE